MSSEFYDYINPHIKWAEQNHLNAFDKSLALQTKRILDESNFGHISEDTLRLHRQFITAMRNDYLPVLDELQSDISDYLRYDRSREHYLRQVSQRFSYLGSDIRSIVEDFEAILLAHGYTGDGPRRRSFTKYLPSDGAGRSAPAAGGKRR